MSAIATLDFALPKELEAREPAELRGDGRDDVRLMVSHRDTGEIEHVHFRELPQFLGRGDLLVLNTSATLPAALTARRSSGEEIALHYSMTLPGGLAVVEPRPAVNGAQSLSLPAGASATLLAPYRDSQRLWIAQLHLQMPVVDYLRRFGRPITYNYVKEHFPLAAYQTVYARETGSAEMPSAGRPITKRLLACLRRSGVRLARIVLHSGVASLEHHERPYEEWFEVPLKTAELVRETKWNRNRVIAVGTTVVRALESSVDRDGFVVASRGWTDLVITPDRGVRVVDGLLTGLHEPKATHLAMLEAIAGRDQIAASYSEALEHGYLWHEFGDMHLIR